ncbi:MAG: nuclear transport factor 2 family protein [Sphingomicrobium sp.]
MLGLIAAAAIHVVPVPPVSPAREPGLAQAPAEAAAVVDRFHDALRRGDGKAALVLLADDAVIYESGMAELSKVEYEAAHLAADIEYSGAVKEIVTRRSGGGGGAKTAWVLSEGRTSGTFQERKINRSTTETMILSPTARGWKITHIHWSSGK